VGWVPGELVGITSVPGAVMIMRDGLRPLGRVNRQGHLWLPAAFRRALRLHAGDRLLVAAWPDAALVLVCPVVALDYMMLAWFGDATNEATP